MSYRFLDHTADVAVALEAPSFPALLAEAVAAFTDTITPLAGVAARRGHSIDLAAGDPEALLVDFLGELLYLYEVDGFLAAEAAVTVDPGSSLLPPFRLTAQVRGETYDPDRHPVKVLVKAITYHGLHVVEEGGVWRARVVFDI